MQPAEVRRDRRQFLATLGASALLTAASGTAFAAPARPDYPSFSHTLVLTGGGARGAYEAGFVSGLAARDGISDGQPLHPYRAVAGTSVGALNAWFVATGQYGAMKRAWHTMAAEHVIALKAKYTTLERPHRFIGERVRAAVRLAVGLTKNDGGIVESQPVLNWMAKHMDPRTPLLMPMVWAVTNLTTQSPEYFYRLPPSLPRKMTVDMLRAFQLTLGHNAVLREASDALLHRALLASAAIPVVFDPVELPMMDGSKAFYVDGAVASNASVSLVRTVSNNVHVVLVDPPSRRATYTNAIDIVMGTYGTMQRKILEVEMRDVYFQSLAKRAIDRLGPGVPVEIEGGSAELTTLLRDLPAVTLAYARPARPLPPELSAFDRQDQLDETFAIGNADSARGFTPYDWETFRL